MLTLYITRHGETEWNTQKRMQGWSDSELTENGKKNAKCLGARLKDINLTTIYSSPSNRTIKTAKLISSARNIPIIINDNLKEIKMGEWEGKTISYLEQTYPNEYFSFWNTPLLYKPMKGETFRDLQSRVIEALNQIQKDNSSGHVLIVTQL
jgi:broad specificity phosphatase PhoE